MRMVKTDSNLFTSLACEVGSARESIAITALVLAFAFVVLLISSCGSSGGLNSYTKAVGAAEEGLAIQTIRAIALAQEQYMATRAEYGNFDALSKAGLLDARFASDAPVVKGYRFTMNAGAATFTINADPQTSEGKPAIGSRHFFLDSGDGILRVNAEQPASASDPPQQ